MKKIILLCLTLAACGEDPAVTQRKIEIENKTSEAAKDCVKRGGDSFTPLGWVSYINMAKGKSAHMFHCVRYEILLGKKYNKTIAIYKLGYVGDTLKLEVRE